MCGAGRLAGSHSSQICNTKKGFSLFGLEANKEEDEGESAVNDLMVWGGGDDGGLQLGSVSFPGMGDGMCHSFAMRRLWVCILLVSVTCSLR